MIMIIATSYGVYQSAFELYLVTSYPQDQSFHDQEQVSSNNIVFSGFNDLDT